jgi:hypothetical protein
MVFSTKPSKTSCEKNFHQKIRLKDTNAKLNVLTTQSTQIVHANGFLQSKVQDSPKAFVAPHHPF